MARQQVSGRCVGRTSNQQPQNSTTRGSATTEHRNIWLVLLFCFASYLALEKRQCNDDDDDEDDRDDSDDDDDGEP